MFSYFCRFVFCLLVLLASCSKSMAQGTYTAPEEFVASAFANGSAKQEVLWITRQLKPAVREILGHDLGQLRVRYWGLKQKTVWVLDEIGKERPITAGVIIDQGRIQNLEVLIFREKRGWEVRYAFFTDQFDNAALTTNNRLSQQIDSISGATLSVNALQKIARLALFLHQQTPYAKS